MAAFWENYIMNVMAREQFFWSSIKSISDLENDIYLRKISQMLIVAMQLHVSESDLQSGISKKDITFL